MTFIHRQQQQHINDLCDVYKHGNPVEKRKSVSVLWQVWLTVRWWQV